MAAELTEAKQLQQAMLPGAPVNGSRLEIAGFNRPCEEAGGDYFDYIHLGNDRVAIVIGDVVSLAASQPAAAPSAAAATAGRFCEKSVKELTWN